MPRFHIRTFGCKVNRIESDDIAADLLDAGWEMTDAADADIAIVNTCTVTAEGEAKGRKYIRSLLRRMAGPVIVCGCAVQIESDPYAGMSPRIVCVCDKQDVAARARQLMDEAAAEIGERQPAPGPDPHDAFRTRPGIKIQDGCDNACTYCIVHTARGPARSVPAEAVLEEVCSRSGAGAREVVLSGIDLGAWEEDGRRLSDLLSTLLEQSDVGRIRLSSIEPNNVDDTLIDLIARSEGRICRHLHLPLQSGSDAVLGAMGRNYDAAAYLDLVGRLHDAIEGLAISTDVIVGFPGEGEQDFEETCRIVEEARFMRLHIFRYSKRPGTPAAEMDGQVDEEVKARRSKELAAIGEELAARDRTQRIGTSEGVIVETDGRGTSESYHTVAVGDAAPTGALVQMRFTGVDETGALRGEVGF